MTYAGRAYGQDVTCSRCGARVDAGATTVHDDWHRKLRGLLRLARALRALAN